MALLQSNYLKKSELFKKSLSSATCLVWWGLKQKIHENNAESVLASLFFFEDWQKQLRDLIVRSSSIIFSFWLMTGAHVGFGTWNVIWPLQCLVWFLARPAIPRTVAQLNISSWPVMTCPKPLLTQGKRDIHGGTLSSPPTRMSYLALCASGANRSQRRPRGTPRHRPQCRHTLAPAAERPARFDFWRSTSTFW